MKGRKILLRLIVSSALMCACFFHVYGQGGVIVEDPLVLAELKLQAAQELEAQAQALDKSIGILDVLRQNSDYTEALYQALSMVKSSPMLAETVRRADRIYKTYDSNLNYMKQAADFSTVSSYSEFKSRLAGMASLVAATAEDIDFVVSFVTDSQNWKATEAERVSILNKINEGLDERISELQSGFINWYVDTFKADQKKYILNPALSGDLFWALFKFTKDPVMLKNAVEHAMNKAGGIDTEQVEKAGAEIKVTFKSTGLKFGVLAILVLTLFYVPFNIYKVNLGERQSNDAVIRIIMGVFLGLVFLGILSFL